MIYSPRPQLELNKSHIHEHNTRYFFAFGLPTKTTICILKKRYNTLKIRKIALGFGHY